MFWLNGCMGGRGRVKSAMQVVHSHGSIEVMLTKSSPEWAPTKLPGGGDDGGQAAESLRAQCGFEAAV